VSEENVVPFHPSRRSGVARRGAPDKTQAPLSETVEVKCPYCAAVLCLEAGVVALRPEVLCAGCDTTIPLGGSQAIDIGG
jgi:hypothetical protein